MTIDQPNRLVNNRPLECGVLLRINGSLFIHWEDGFIGAFFFPFEPLTLERVALLFAIALKCIGKKTIMK
jgi:hypothetical protein